MFSAYENIFTTKIKRITILLNVCAVVTYVYVTVSA